MTICGYDERMGRGLREFAAGLSAAIRSKAATAGVEEREQLQREADQIFILSAYLHEQFSGTTDESLRQAISAFFGLVLMSRGLLGSGLSSTGTRNLEETLRVNCEALIEILREFERQYDSAPEGSAAVHRTEFAWTAVQPLLKQLVPV